MFSLEFKTENAAFGDSPGEKIDEIVAVLRRIANEMERDRLNYGFKKILDLNGNYIGYWQVAPDENEDENEDEINEEEGEEE